MSISFGEIYLYSLDPAKLYDFLSFLLDVEAQIFEADKIHFEFQGIHFVILRSHKKRIDKTQYFSLNVSSLEELEYIGKNIEFYHYKGGDKNLKLDLSESSLSFRDPDERLWRVNLEKNKNYQLPKGSNFTDVRIC